MNEVTVLKQIYDNKPNLKVYDKEGYEVKVGTVSYDNEGKIISITDDSGNTYLPENVNIYEDFLVVPGVGYLRPGTKVEYKNDLYYLEYGWHVNTSNQSIYSWYLVPCKSVSDLVPYQYYMSSCVINTDDTYKTLYYEDICNITKIVP